LRDNTDGDLKAQSFRDMLTNQIIGILSAPSSIKKMGATVLTESASMYDPKLHGPKGQRPESV
jgi:hypothetical protein